jgi:hypothetical protein
MGALYPHTYLDSSSLPYKLLSFSFVRNIPKETFFALINTLCKPNKREVPSREMQVLGFVLR